MPQRTKHIYHHQVKKVPVYVLLPEKKSKVLDDLEEVTKVLPCRERDREREPPWQDEIAAGPPPSPSPSKYRYARHYDRIREPGDVDVDSYSYGYDHDTASIWQQDTKRSLQPPAPPQRHQQPQPQQHQHQQQQQQTPRPYKSARQMAATADHHRTATAASVPANYEYNDADIGGGIIRSSSRPASLFQKGVRDAVGGAGSTRGGDRTRYARYYEDEDDYKSVPRSTAASLVKSNSNPIYDDGRYNNRNANRNSFASVDVDRLAESRGSGGGGNDNVGQNLIRISYPPSPLSASSPSSSASADSSFYPGTGTGSAAAAAATAASYHFSADRNQRRPQRVPSTSLDVPVAAVDNNYASSYQYKIQH